MVRTCLVRERWIHTATRGTRPVLTKWASPLHCSRTNCWIRSDSPATIGLQSCALKLQVSTRGGVGGMPMKRENFQKGNTKHSWKFSCLIKKGSDCNLLLSSLSISTFFPEWVKINSKLYVSTVSLFYMYLKHILVWQTHVQDCNKWSMDSKLLGLKWNKH